MGFRLRVNTILALILVTIVAILIVTQVKECHLQDDPKLRELKSLLRPMFASGEFSGILSGLNNSNILDDITMYKGKKSYTINKEKVYLCLRDERGSYYNLNILVYVTLHEIAHCYCDEVGHTKKFHEIFEALIDKAVEWGVYNPSIPMIEDYCKYGDSGEGE